MVGGNAEVFQPEDLDLIEQAFQQTWAVLTENTSRDARADEELKIFIRKKLMTLASAGIADVEMMRKMVLAALATRPASQ
jgi:hypothetical protein